MAWNNQKQNGAKHNDSCVMAFGRPSPIGICARCDELRAGSAPRKGWNTRAMKDAARSKEIHAHFASEYHRSGKCGVVCTFGEW